MSTLNFKFLEERLFNGVSDGVAEGLRHVRAQEAESVSQPKWSVQGVLTTEMVVEWSMRGDPYLMDRALPYLQQGKFHENALKLVCHHLVSGSETDYFCTNYLLRTYASDCDKWGAMMPNLRQTTALYSVAKFILADCASPHVPPPKHDVDAPRTFLAQCRDVLRPIVEFLNTPVNLAFKRS